MKTKNRITKAFIVIVVVGIGLVYNTNIKLSFNSSTHESSIILEQSQVNSDTIKINNKFFIYTESIIRTGIQQLISNL